MITRCYGRVRGAGRSDLSKKAMSAREVLAAPSNQGILWPRELRRPLL
ncbi:MAG: hypothetical protein ACK55Z_14055 [bacterium]